LEVVSEVLWAIPVVVGIAVGIVLAWKRIHKAWIDYKNTVLKPLWDALMRASIRTTSFANFVKAVWQEGQFLAIAMYKNQKGATGIIAVIFTVIAAAIAIILGVVVYAYVATSVPTDRLDPNQTALIHTVDANVNTSFMLLAVAIIVLAVSVILGILLRVFSQSS
jgi:hypothetical protein